MIKMQFFYLLVWPICQQRLLLWNTFSILWYILINCPEGFWLRSQKSRRHHCSLCVNRRSNNSMNIPVVDVTRQNLELGKMRLLKVLVWHFSQLEVLGVDDVSGSKFLHIGTKFKKPLLLDRYRAWAFWWSIIASEESISQVQKDTVICSTCLRLLLFIYQKLNKVKSFLRLVMATLYPIG